MGSYLPRCTSQPLSQPRPLGIKQLNDAVYELYKPATSPSVDVIFFHGLEQDLDYEQAFWKTWLSRDDPSVVWPKAWLSEKLPKARILSISYDSAAQKHKGTTDTYLIAENLIGDIILGNVKAGQNCPVILVGHCLGGLIIKEFLLGCMKCRGLLVNNENAQGKLKLIENFLRNCMGVFYYATPHSGTKIAEYLVQVKGEHGVNEPLIKLLRILSDQTSRINDDFARARHGEKIRSEAIGESLETTYMGFTGKLVEEASARVSVDNFYTAPNSNHFDVCKARNSESCGIFMKLHGFIDSVLEANGSETKAEARGQRARQQLTSQVRPGIMTLQRLGL